MGTRIFVGNLSYGSSEAALRAHFEEAGFEVIGARIIADRETGQSRGFGFVELAGDDQAQRAIADLDGSELEGRRLSVREAHDRRSGPAPDGARGGRFRGPRPEGSRPVVERVGAGEDSRAYAPRDSRPRPAYRDAPSWQERSPYPQDGPGRGEGRRGRKFDGRKGGRRRDRDDEDDDW